MVSNLFLFVFYGSVCKTMKANHHILATSKLILLIVYKVEANNVNF